MPYYLVLGYSANTVSLLASGASRSGSVVDERHRRGLKRRARDGGGTGSFAARSTRRPDPFPAPIIAITLYFCRVRGRLPSFPEFSGNAVPPVRGDDQLGDDHLRVDALRPWSPALCPVFLRPHRAAARHLGARARRHRLGGANPTGRRRAPAAPNGPRCRLCSVLVFAGCVFRCFAVDADRVLPKKIRGPFSSRAIAGRRSVSRTSESTHAG